jgi:hypothetical protein
MAGHYARKSSILNSVFILIVVVLRKIPRSDFSFAILGLFYLNGRAAFFFLAFRNISAEIERKILPLIINNKVYEKRYI